MKPGNPWSVKGIQPAARQAAKEAARRHGMTLGQWLNHVIMDGNPEQNEAPPQQQAAPKQQKPQPQPSQAQPEQSQTAAQTPVQQAPPAQRQAPEQQASIQSPTASEPKSQHLQDKIEDLAAKLDSIVDKQSGKVDLDQWITSKDRSSSGWSDIAVRNVSRENTPDTSAAPQNAPGKYEYSHDRRPDVYGERISALTDKLDSVVEARAATNSRSEQSLKELEAALRNVIKHIELSDRQNTDVMKSIQARLSELSSRTAVSNNETVQQLGGTIGEMNDRLSHLAQRVMNTETKSAEFLSFEEKIKSLTNRLDNSLDRGPEPQVIALEERIDQLAVKFDGFLQASETADTTDQYEERINEIAHQVKNTEQYSGKLSSLEESINHLFEAVEQNRYAAQENTLSASQKSIDAMDSMVENAAQKAAENAARRSAEHVAAIMADDGLNKKEVTASIENLRKEMQNTQDTTIRTAQQSAEEIISANLSGQVTDAIAEPMMVLRQEFDHLQDSSRSAELRNQDTLEAVHDTLEKVVERLVTLETSPLQAADRPPLPSLSIPDISKIAPAKFDRPFHISDELEDEPVHVHGEEVAVTSAEADTEYGHEPRAEDNSEDYDAHTTFSKQQEEDNTSEAGSHDEVAAAPVETVSESSSPTLNHNFLEAARRAAQAASQAPRNLSEIEIETDEIADTDSTSESKTGLLAMATQNDKKRKTLLLVAATILLVIGALSAGSLMTERPSNVANSTVSPPNAALPNSKSKNSTAKENKAPADDQSLISPKIAKPIVSPVSQNSTLTSAVKDVQVTGKSAQTQNSIVATSPSTPPKITASTALPLESVANKPLKPLVNSQPATDDLKVARLNAPDSNQPTTDNTVPSAPALEPLPPEAIGPIALRRAASEGDAVAQFEIAARYTTGKLVPQNFAKAISWYQKAAAQGLAPAQYRLGTFYEKGRGVTKDKTAARIWYERAAAKGNLKAIHNLAVIHADGSKGKPDFSKAGLWFRKAAELGLADSQYNLAILHDRGLGVSKDPSTAYFWFQIAGSQGDKDALARAEIIEKRLTPDQIARTKLLISNWNPRTLNKNANEVSLPIDGWQSPTTTSSTNNPSFTQKELVVLTQGYLAKLGFDPGPNDGILGTQTREAIEQFQAQNQLPVSGLVSSQLVGRLKAATK